MYGKVCDWVKGGFGKAVSYVCLAIAVVSVTAGDLLAQETQTVTVTPPEIDWGTTAQTLISSMTGVVIVGLGIALSIWALLMVARLFKRSAT